MHATRCATKRTIHRLVARRSLGERFCLTRIVGNDLSGRHSIAQSIGNTKFILENEKEYEGCQKVWLLNRIVDPDIEDALERMLIDAGRNVIKIPFVAAEYRHVKHDDVFPDAFINSASFREMDRDAQMRALMALYRSKMLYVMNVNAARNRAIDEGRNFADWIMPFDGNCFLTPAGWSELSQSVLKNQMFDYHVVPMARVADNDQVFDPELSGNAFEEPQLIFARTAKERFDSAIPYARRNKVELLMRLGVYGPEHQLKYDPWDLKPGSKAGDYGLFNPRAGWVARLSSGNPHLDVGPDAAKLRYFERITSVLRFVDDLDRKIGLPSMLGDYLADSIEPAFSDRG